jgi:hypothetical protein
MTQVLVALPLDIITVAGFCNMRAEEALLRALFILFLPYILQVAAYDTLEKKMAFFDPSRAEDFLFISGTKVRKNYISFLVAHRTTQAPWTRKVFYDTVCFKWSSLVNYIGLFNCEAETGSGLCFLIVPASLA